MQDRPLSQTDELELLLQKLPARIQDAVRPHAEGLEEVLMDLGSQLCVRVGDTIHYKDHVVTEDDIDYLQSRVTGLKSNGRGSIPGTLHRVSRKADDLERAIGFTLRFGRHVFGVAEPLRSYLDSIGSMMVVGGPGVGKSTLLRDMVRISAEKYGPRVCVADSALEIGGAGQIAHPCIGRARRFHVPSPSMQEKILVEIITNHSPKGLYVDEMGYAKDVAVVEKAARSGIWVVGSVHGENLSDVLENPMLFPLIGSPDRAKGKRLTRPVFKTAVEVVAKGKYIFYSDLAQTVDELLADIKPEGVKLGQWENQVAEAT